jgi:ribosomal-protein-alanine N-acetyltransferase
MGAPCRIRPARAADVARVHAIERASFGDPWSARAFEEALEGGAVFLVAETGAEVVGYLVARWAAAEGEILNLAVAPKHRRGGVGRALIAHALDRLARLGAGQAYLEVRESNTAARRLYEGLGFAAVGRRRRYYRHPAEDAVVLRAAILAVGGDAKL